jgi:outer membrane lipoprotein carrier protein
VQKYYADVKQIQADFRQIYDNTVVGKKSTSDGKVYIAKPGKMYWWYKKPDEKFFISDGTTLWAYEKTNKQAFKQDLKDQVLPVAITFLYGQGDLTKDFTADMDQGAYGGKGDWVVKLTPKQPAGQYKTLWLVVDPSDGHVKESVILEVGGNINHFKFTNVKENSAAKDVKDRLFKFVPPQGVKVIEPPKTQEEDKAHD